MKRIICYIMALAAITTVKAQNKTEATVPGNWTNCRTTITTIDDVNRTMTITSAEELAMLANGLNTSGHYANYTVTLANDLDLDGHFWIPIGTTTHPFIGTFDGRGHTISNLRVYVDGTKTGNVAGLFGKIGEGGVVQDVNIHQMSVMFESLTDNSATCAVGSIAGYNSGTIVGCSNTALVSGDWQNASVGGIAGENGSTGVIQNCYNLGEVYVNNSTAKIGGIVGENNHTVQNCFFKAPSGQTKTHVYICGNSGGPVTGCFYVGGKSTDTTQPIVTVLHNSLRNTNSLRNIISESAKNILLDGRTIYGDGAWNTLCLPFDIPQGAEGRSPIAGAEVKQLENSSFAEGTLTLDFEDVTSIKAGMPYIVKWADTKISELSNPVFLNVTVSATTSSRTVMPQVDFVGTYDPKTFKTGDNTVLYLGGDNTLYYPSGAFTINAFRAYFQLKDGLIAGDGSAGIRSFVLNFDGERETQGIIAPTVSASSADASWTTLGGQRLAAKPTRPGLYIQQGRKVIVK